MIQHRCDKLRLGAGERGLFLPEAVLQDINTVLKDERAVTGNRLCGTSAPEVAHKTILIPDLNPGMHTDAHGFFRQCELHFMSTGQVQRQAGLIGVKDFLLIETAVHKDRTLDHYSHLPLTWIPAVPDTELTQETVAMPAGSTRSSALAMDLQLR